MAIVISNHTQKYNTKISSSAIGYIGLYSYIGYLEKIKTTRLYEKCIKQIEYINKHKYNIKDYIYVFVFSHKNTVPEMNIKGFKRSTIGLKNDSFCVSKFEHGHFFDLYLDECETECTTSNLVCGTFNKNIECDILRYLDILCDKTKIIIERSLSETQVDRGW